MIPLIININCTMLPNNFAITQEMMAELISTVIRYPSTLFQSEAARMSICAMRLQEAQSRGFVECSQDSKFSIENTVRHNLESLNPQIAARRPWAILGPLLGVDNINKNLPEIKVLIVGPRTEAEILLYLSMGFQGKNIIGLDLISYSDFIVKGDMHDMPFKDEEFDIVIFSWVLGYSTNQKIAVKEAVRVLKDGGYICIGEQWDPAPIDAISSQMEIEKGYSLMGTVTTSTSDLRELIGEHFKESIFETQPLDHEKDRPGWITCLATIKK